MNILAIIPARMGSSRFPGKPMAQILGKPMIGHVYESVSKSSLLKMTAVATCDEVIFDYIKSIGGIAVMTSDSHERASDRCAEALAKLEESYDVRYDIVVMVQGDEPMVHPDMIAEAIQPMLNNSEIKVVNLFAKIRDLSEFEDRNCIKVVCDSFGNALYYSREPIPSNSKTKILSMYKQVCVIPFKREYLLHYNNLPETQLEAIESIDMLRILENGDKVKMILTNHHTQSVDTIEDLKKVESLMEKLI